LSGRKTDMVTIKISLGGGIGGEVRGQVSGMQKEVSVCSIGRAVERREGKQPEKMASGGMRSAK